jgi:hypothetical protein
MKVFCQLYLFAVLCTSVYSLAIKEKISNDEDEVVVVYPSAEIEDDKMFQNRRSGSIAPNDVPIDVPVSPDNRFNYNGRIQKLGHCNQNTACIAQLSCSDTPFDHGTNCANDAWPDHSLGRKVAWSFNINSGKCQSFGYGGCDGSLNTFQTRIECENLCVPKGVSRPRSPNSIMSPVTDFFKSVMTKVNSIPNWIQERLGKRRLDSKIDNVQEGSKQVEVKAEQPTEAMSSETSNECWIPIFCSMQKKVQNWFQERMGSRRNFPLMEKKAMKKQKHVPNFGRRRL